MFDRNAKPRDDLYVTRCRRKDGKEFSGETFGAKLLDEHNQWIGNLGVMRDITEKEQTELRIQQAQKMESIGNLAAGIAHDFNNILFPIIGMSEMLLEDLPEESLDHENVLEILKAGKRGRDLVKQILAFSRQTENRKIPIRIQYIVKEVLKLYRATIPTNIDIKQNIQTDCGLVMADPTQIHQVAMNIITNAYHAVEERGGSITLELTESVSEGPAFTGADAGRYVNLSISDTGHGMPPELKKKIFDPYFTTKEKGKGTGLGLAMVYGIVKNHNGEVEVHSEVGKGTIFNVYLPLLETTGGADSI